MKIYQIAIILVSFLCSHAALSSEKETFSVLDDFVTQIKSQTNLPSGTSIALIKNGKVVYNKGFGYADINGKVKANADTRYYIASATKPLFALSTLLYQEQGKFDENKTVAEMFPHIKFEGIDAKAITLKALLSHTSAINNADLVTATAYTGIHDFKSRQELIAQSKPYANMEVGEFKYSNIGYNIASTWVESEFSQAWQDLLADTLFTPLGMHNTSAYVSDSYNQGVNIAKSYWMYSEDNQKPLYLTKQDNTMHSAGGVNSSATDLSNLLLTIMNNGKLNGEQILPANIVNKSLENIAEFDEWDIGFPNKGYGWGWFQGEHLGYKIYSHLGGFSGAHSHVSFIPELKAGVIILNNEGHVYRNITKHISYIAYNLLLDKPIDEAEIKKIQSNIVSHNERMTKLISEDRINRQSREWQLSLDKSEYAGTYSHPSLGNVVITQQVDKSLEITWGNLKGTIAPHKYKDVLRVEMIPGRGWRLDFTFDEDKKVKSVKLEINEFIKQ